MKTDRPDPNPYRPIPRYEHPPGPRQPIGLRLLAVGALVGAIVAAAISLPPPKSPPQVAPRSHEH